jgi:adenylate kinase family enzyme
VQPTILALIGKPLAGKDTQADLLVAENLHAVKISTGHVIRAVREEGETHRFWPILGPYLAMMEQGIKLPDEPIIAVLGQMIKEQIAEGKTLLIIAGSPRSVEQLEGFDKIAEETHAKLTLLHLDVTDGETDFRRAHRNEGRVDDEPEVHKVRLEEYRTHVEPMTDLLKATGRLSTVDAMNDRYQVLEDIHKVLLRTFDPEVRLPVHARR